MHPIQNFLGANSTCQRCRTAVKTNYAKLSDLIFLQESSSHSRPRPQFKEVQVNEWNARPFILIWECQLSGQWKHPISSHCWDHRHHHQCTIHFLSFFYPAVEILGDLDCFLQEIVPFSWLLLCLGSGNADTQQALENWPEDKMLYLLAPRVSLCRFSILTILNFG